MFGRTWGRTPRAAEADPWNTLTPLRTVLAVARTVTSATRLLDVLPVLDGDLRIQVLFTVNEGSAFGDGVAGFLRDIEARVVPWREATTTRFDLAISASANGDLHRVKAPLLVLPHGVGHNRFVASATGRRDVASGLAGRQLMHRGRVVPAAIALSHAEQLTRLRGSCPPAAERAVVVGDPCFDRMVASLPLRGRYRRALGVEDDHELLVFTSTWGPDSLFGRRPHLLARWVAELPVDRHRVALILHPNVWSRHSGRQIDAWLAEARHAGLMLIPPQEGWRAALIAADRIVGDHGSVTFYGAALEQPTLLAAFGAGELDPRSPLAAFGRTQPRLDPDRGLRDQLADLTATPVTGDALGMRGEAARNLRSVMYDLMRLPPPPVAPRTPPIPVPLPRRREVSAMQIEGVARGGLVELDRFPATVDTASLADPHLLVDEGETDRRLLESAVVFVRRAPGAGAEAWAADVLARYPGALVAAAATGESRCSIALYDGRRLRARGADVAVCASAVYVRLTGALPVTGAGDTITVRTGPRDVLVHVIA